MADVAEHPAEEWRPDLLDMLARGPCSDGRGRAAPGGVLIGYVATTTQLSRLVEALRGEGGFTEPVPGSAASRLARRRSGGPARSPDAGHTAFL